MKKLTKTFKITKIPKHLEDHFTAEELEVVLRNWYGIKVVVTEVKR